MTKIAIISDIHANVEALRLVLNDIEKRGVDKIVCLGDIVTKYYYPRDCVDIIKNNCDVVVKGNCDNHVATNEKYIWARNQLKTHRIEYLFNLPAKEQMYIGKTLINFYHSNPKDLEQMFNPLFKENDKTSYKDKTIYDYNEMFPSSAPQTTIVGHTHMNYIGIEEEGKLKIIKDDTKENIILPTDKAILNAGSVGEPNRIELEDGRIKSLVLPYLTYLIIDDTNLKKGFSAKIIKVPYRETLKKVFIDSIENQKKGLFPYSPNDSRMIANSIIEQNPNDNKIKKEVNEKLEELKKIKGKK